MSIEYKDRGALHKLFNSQKLNKLSSKPIFKVTTKTLLATETTALFAKDLIANHFVGKETHVKFDRTQSSSGKFHTTVKFVRADKPVYRESGLLHRARDFGRRFESFPSVSIEKKLHNMQPKTQKGKLLLGASKFTVHTAKKPLKLVGKVLLTADTAAYAVSSAGFHKLTSKARAEFNQADTGKAVLSAVSTLKTISQARKIVVQKKLRKSSFKLKKQEFVNEKAKTKKEKASFKKEKRLFKAEKRNNKVKIKKIKQTPDFNANRIAVLKGRTVYKKKQLKLSKQAYKNQKKFKRHARKNKHLDMPVPLSLTATAFLGGQIFSQGWRQIVSVDENNDFVKAFDKSTKVLNSARKHSSNISKKARHRNSSKRSQKLNKKHNKLKNKSNKLRKNKRKKVKNKQKAAKTKQKVMQTVSKAFISFATFAFKLLAALAGPFLLILMIIAIVLTMFGSCSSNGTYYILGTYNCRDDDIASAIDRYTSLANDMNENIIKCQESSEWKTGLQNLGVDTSSYKDTPDEFVFGKSNVHFSVNYTPVYDFEADKLIAFMCAYTYNFTDENTGAGSTSNQDIEYWTYDSSNHDSVIQELFELEYEFKYYYLNTSHWVNLNSYEVFPDNDSFWYADQTGITSVDGTRYGFITYSGSTPTELSNFAVDNTVHFDLNTGEVRNRNDEYDKTGYYIQNLELEYTDPSGGKVNAFYSIFHNSSTGQNFMGFMGPNNVPQKKTQLYVGNYKFDYAMANRDARIWVGDQTLVGSRQLVRDYRAQEYKKECKLYTTVRQKMTFDQAILYMLNNKDEYSSSRLEFYNTIMGVENPDKRTYGNHQMYLSPLTTDFADLSANGKIYNDYGYDMQQWGTKHCSIDHHTGIDIEVAAGAEVKAIISGKVESIDTSKHLLTLQTTSDMEYWYEDKSRATKIIYENISPSVSVGDQVNAGDIIGVVDNYKHCYDNVDNSNANKNYLHLSVEIQYDWWQWKSVNPQFLIYRNDSDASFVNEGS